MINKLSVIDDLKDMIRKNFPDLSEEEIEDLINKVRGKINKGNNAKEIFKEDIRPVLDADSTPPGNKV
jgi:cellulose synthase/poly-beta-1,6-N-acetylglucosamine synthase-like glycosyltransferase